MYAIRSYYDLKYNNEAFIENDPVSIPHRFSLAEDVEISGLLAASIAWGQRATIVRNALRMVQLMDNHPYDFIMNYSERDKWHFQNFVHRTFNGRNNFV